VHLARRRSQLHMRLNWPAVVFWIAVTVAVLLILRNAGWI
jgi:uncharacterized membrane protein YdfJ with MMPL/SSD domain